MTRKPSTPVKTFLAGIALFVGFGVVFLLLWIIAHVVLAGLIFAALTLFTNWSPGARIGCSLLTAIITLKVLGLITGTLDMIPESWIDAKKKTKPCPECGKNLRTALAQQCKHCGADWHIKSHTN